MRRFIERILHTWRLRPAVDHPTLALLATAVAGRTRGAGWQAPSRRWLCPGPGPEVDA